MIVDIVITDIDFKANNIIRNKNDFIMIEVLIYQKDITILNVYVPNNKASKYKKQMIELQREINKSTIIFSDFNTFFSKINRTNRKA